MSNGPGFYKSVGDGLNVTYASNYVYSPGYSLVAKTHINNPSAYVFPIDGWSWYDTEDAARTAMGLPSSTVTSAANALLEAYPSMPKSVAITAANGLITIDPTFTP